MKRFLFAFQVLLLCMFSIHTKVEAGQWLVNHVGYEMNGSKNAVFQLSGSEVPSVFELLNDAGKVVYSSKFEKGGKVDNWHTGNAYAANFSEFKTVGTFKLSTTINAKIWESDAIVIGHQVVAQQTLETLLQGIHSQRSAGEFDEKDKKMSFHGQRNDTVDVHGGWYDASGDRSKYLSHLSYANYMNPQQAPMVVWNFLATSKALENYLGDNTKSLGRNVIEEAIHGADWLVRMYDKEGYFYLNVFDNWSWDVNKRSICAYVGIEGFKNDLYKAGYRMGGGMSIAALARASSQGLSGAFSATDYLRTAQKAFDYLEKNNRLLLPNGEENIIDDYCALMAATELFVATKDKKYLQAAQKRMFSLVKRQTDDENVKGFWGADNAAERPFFHAAEAGLPIVSLVRYLTIETDDSLKKFAIKAIRRSVDFELWVSAEVNNPFGYARQYVKATNEQSKRTAFFMPQQNETGYWWQGENARLASLSSAMHWAMPYLENKQLKKAKAYASHQINWILGLNPYNMSMLEGVGRNNPAYIEAGVSKNVKGCVCNGITGGVANENNITFLPYPQREDPANKWRWSEQWLQHGSWLMLAIASSL